MTISLSDSLHAAREELHSRAAPQGGAFRRSDLAAWGMDDATLRALIRRRLAVRLRHGIYTDVSLLDAAYADETRMHLLNLSAAVLGLDYPAYAFGQSAAVLLGLPLPHRVPENLSLIRPLRSDLRALRRPSTHHLVLPNLIVTTHSLNPATTGITDGIPVVGRHLAAISTAAQLPLDWAVGVLDSVLWDEPDAAGLLRETLDDWPLMRGCGVVRRALDIARPGAQTILESLSRVRLCRAGLPEPQLQVPMYDAQGLIGIVDMWWESLGVVGEADGAVKYDDRQVLYQEKIREDRIRAKGLRFVRWGWEDTKLRMDWVADQIRSAARRSA